MWNLWRAASNISLEDSDQVERLCASALSKPDKNAAIRFLNDAIPTLTTHLPGIHNEGLLSIQELQFGTKNREDWENAIAKSNNPSYKSESLINSLGFQSTNLII